MPRTAIISSRPAITIARSALSSSRASAGVYRIPIAFFDMGLTYLWDFRTGFNGTNSRTVTGMISNCPMFYRGTTAIGSVYTAGGYSIDLERTNSDYLATNPISYGASITSMTYFAWIKRESTGAIHHIHADWETAGNQRGSRLYLNSDTFEVSLSTNGTTNTSYTSTETLTDTTNWHFITATYDTTNRCQMRLDNSALTVTLTAGSHPANINSSRIAKMIGANLPTTPANFFDGKIGICGVAINKALTTAEQTFLYDFTGKLMGV